MSPSEAIGPDARRSALTDWGDLARAEAAAQHRRAAAARDRATTLRSGRLLGAPPDLNRPDETDLTANEVILLAAIPLGHLYEDYVAMGGNRNSEQIANYLSGEDSMPDLQIEIFSHALYEYLKYEDGSPGAH